MPRLIDAEHLKKRATDWEGDCWDNYAQSTEDFLEYIDNEPTVDAVPVRHGRWTSCQGLAEVGECQCSSCKTIYYEDDLYNNGETDENGCGQALLPNYCPHCGARMDEVRDE